MSDVDHYRQVTITNSDVTDTSFKVPGDQPGEEPYSLENNRAQQWDWYIHIENGFDADIDATVEGSHDGDGLTDNTLDSPATDGATENIVSGSIDFFDGTTQHSYIQVDVDPLSDPTSGDLVITFQARK